MGGSQSPLLLQLGVGLRRVVPFLIAALLLDTSLTAQTIPAGQWIEVQLESAVTTKTAKTGDAVRARFADDVKRQGRVVIPAGSTIAGTVDFVQRKSATIDGALRLIFRKIALPDGRSVETLATASFQAQPKKGRRTTLLAVLGFGGIGAIIGGKTKRVAAGLGGAIIGLVFAQNHRRYGEDMNLNAGKTIQVRLSADLKALPPDE